MNRPSLTDYKLKHLQLYSQKILLSPMGSSQLCFSKASFTDLLSKLSSFLHPNEIIYFNSLPSSKRQYTYLLGRYVAKNAICAYQEGFSASDVLIKPGIFDQPIIYSESLHNLKVSISHTNEQAAALIFPEAYPMGIDIELINPDTQKVVENLLTENEKKWIDTNAEKKPILSVLIWTIKEALSKAIHTGMTIPFHLYSIKNIVAHDEYWIVDFDYFNQYQSKSFLIGNHICSIAHPKQIELEVDIRSIRELFCYPRYDLSFTHK